MAWIGAAFRFGVGFNFVPLSPSAAVNYFRTMATERWETWPAALVIYPRSYRLQQSPKPEAPGRLAKNGAG